MALPDLKDDRSVPSSPENDPLRSAQLNGKPYGNESTSVRENLVAKFDVRYVVDPSWIKLIVNLSRGKEQSDSFCA